MSIQVKICGLTQVAQVEAVAEAGADYAGFVFFEKSPRHVSLETARKLALAAEGALTRVALTVNAEDAFLDQLVETVPLDMLQLHGGESPARVAEVRARYGLPVMKAVGIAEESDLRALMDYAAVADQVLIDAKPPKGADLPGGNGLAFDWRLVQQAELAGPWMLAGGLRPENVAEAIRMTGAQQVDVSSGVESAPGKKDAGLIQEFVAAAKATV